MAIGSVDVRHSVPLIDQQPDDQPHMPARHLSGEGVKFCNAVCKVRDFPHCNIWRVVVAVWNAAEHSDGAASRLECDRDVSII